ncbi:MAG: hypothetical protein Q9165_001428 [Trypethelium subeluteriae]
MESSSPGPSKDLSLSDQVEHIKELISLSYSGANEGFSHQIFRRSRGLTTGHSQILRELDSLKQNYKQQQARRDSAAEDVDDLPSAGEESVERGRWSDEDNFQRELKDIRRRNEEALEFAEERIDHLDDERGELSKSVQDLRSILEERDQKHSLLSETIEQTRAELRQARTENDEASGALFETRQQVEKLDHLLTEATAKNKGLQTLMEKNQRLEQIVEEIKQSLFTKTQEVREVTSAMQDERANHEHELNELRDSLEEATLRTKEFDKLTQAHRELEKKSEGLESKVHERQKQMDGQQGTLKCIADERDEIRVHLDEMKKLTDSRNRELKELSEQNQEALKRSQHLQASLSQKDRELSTAREEMQELQATHDSEKDSRWRSLEDANEALERARQDAAEARHASEAVQTELNDWKTLHVEKDGKITTLQEDLRRAHSEYKKQREGLEGNLRELDSQLSKREKEARTARDALEGVRITYIKQSHNLEDTLDEVRSSLSATKQEAEESKAALLATRDELESLRTVSEAAKAEYAHVMSDRATAEENWKKASEETRQSYEFQLSRLREKHEDESQTMQEKLENARTKYANLESTYSQAKEKHEHEIQTMQDKVENARTNYADLESNYSQAKEEHSSAKAQLEHEISEVKIGYENQKQDLQKQLHNECLKQTETETAHAETKNELSVVRGQLGDVQESLERQQGEARSLQDQLKTEQSTLLEVKNAHNTASNEHAKSKQQLENLQETIEAYERNFQNLQADLKHEQSSFTELQNSYKKVKEEHGVVESRLEDLQMSSDQLRQLHEEQFGQALKDLAGERSKLAVIEKADQVKADQLREAEEQIKHLQHSENILKEQSESRINELESEIKKSRSKMAELEQGHGQMLKDIAEERSNVSRMHEARRVASEQFEEKERQLVDVEQSLSQAKQDLEIRLRDLEHQADESRSKSKEANEAHEKALGDLSKERKRIMDTEEAYKSTSQRLQAMTNDYKALRDTSSQSLQSMESRVQELETKLKESQSSFAKAESDHQREVTAAEGLHKQRLSALDQELANAMSKLVGLEAALEESRHTADIKHQENLTRLNEEASKFSEAERIHSERVQILERERDESVRQIADANLSHGDVKKALDSRITQFEKQLEKETSRFRDAEQAHSRRAASMEQERQDAYDRADNLQKMIDEIQQTRRQDVERSNRAAEEERSRVAEIEQNLRQRLKNMEQANTMSLEEAHQETATLQKQFGETKNKHWRKLQEIQEKHDSELEQLRTSAGDGQKRLRETEFSHRSALKDLEDHMAFKLTDAESTKRKELQELKDKHQQQIKDAEQSLKAVESRSAEERTEVERIWKREAENARGIGTRKAEELRADYTRRVREGEESQRIAMAGLQERHAHELSEVQSRKLKELEEARMKSEAAMKASRESHQSELTTAKDLHSRLMLEAEVAHKSELASLDSRMTRRIADLEASLVDARSSHGEALANIQERHAQQTTETDERHKSTVADLEARLSRKLADSEVARKEMLTSQAEEHARLVNQLRESHRAQVQDMAEAHERVVQDNQEAATEGLQASEYHRQVLEETLGNEKQIFETKLTDLRDSHRAALVEIVANAQSKSESEITARAAQHESDLASLRELHSTELTAMQSKLQEALETSKRTADEKASVLSEMGSLRQQLDNSLLEVERERTVGSNTADEINILKQRLEEASTYQKNFTRRMEEEMQRVLEVAKSIEEERDMLAAQVATMRLRKEGGTSDDKSAEDSLRKRLLQAKKRESRYFKEQDFLKTQVRALEQQLQQGQFDSKEVSSEPREDTGKTIAVLPQRKNTAITSNPGEGNADLRRENDELRQQLSDLRLELVRAKAAAKTQRQRAGPNQPEISRKATLDALENGSRPQKTARQTKKSAKRHDASPQSFEEYLRRAELELSDLGKAISANETLFAQKIREHVGDLQKAKDHLSGEYTAKHEAMLQERAELEQRLATKQDEDLAQARAELIAQYTSDIGTPKGEESSTKVEELTPRRKQELKDADAQLVAEHDYKVATKKSQIEIKHEQNVQILSEQFDAKISRLLQDRANLENDLSISPSEFEQMSKSFELEVERLHLGSPERENGAIAGDRMGTAKSIPTTPTKVGSPPATRREDRIQTAESSTMRSPIASDGTSSPAQGRKEKFRMIGKPEPSRSFLESPSPARNRARDGTRAKVVATQRKPSNVLPIPHRIAAAQTASPAQSGRSRNQTASPSSPRSGDGAGSYFARRGVASPTPSYRPASSVAARGATGTPY